MSKRPIAVEDLLKITYVGDPQIHRDGDSVLFSAKTVNDKHKYLTHLFSVDRRGAVKQWTRGEANASHGRWSPDGARIAFISDRKKPGSQIFVLSTKGGEAIQLTKLPEGSVGEFAWSPDGTKIAFLFRDAVPGLTEKEKKARTEKEQPEPPIEIDDVWYRLDGDGYFANQRFKLYLVDASEPSSVPGAEEGREPCLLYEQDVYGNYSFDWAPDSKSLAVIHSASKRPFVDPPNDQIYIVPLDGAPYMLPDLPAGEKSQPKWSPDSSLIAYAGSVAPDDPWGVYNTHVYLVPAQGGAPKDLTGELDYDMSVGTLSDTKEASFGSVLEWKPDGSGVFVQVGWHGEVQLGFVPATGGVQLLTEGHHALTVGNVSRDGRAIAATFGHASLLPEVAIIGPELVTGRLTSKVLTSFNHTFHDEVHVQPAEEFWVDSTDGVRVQGWVIKPVGFVEGKKYPTILQIHGGPHAQYGWAFFHEFQLQAANGYVVVYTNPRGSKGYGEKFCAAIRGDWGTKDWDDIQTVIAWMKKQPFVDTEKLGVMGGSYGGYMTNWVIGHSDEFKAAITDRCVSNFVSMAGNSDFPFNKDGYFKGVAWGSLNEISELWRQSPIAYFQNVKTPTLIIHSQGDLRCNIEQSEQVFTALQMQGVPSRFVRYPTSTSHGMSRSGPPDLRIHRLTEIVSWLDKYLKP